MQHCEEPEIERPVTYRKTLVYTAEIQGSLERCNMDKELLRKWAERQE